MTMSVPPACAATSVSRVAASSVLPRLGQNGVSKAMWATMPRPKKVWGRAPRVRSMTWSGTTMCSGAISSLRLPTALTEMMCSTPREARAQMFARWGSSPGMMRWPTPWRGRNAVRTPSSVPTTISSEGLPKGVSTRDALDVGDAVHLVEAGAADDGELCGRHRATAGSDDMRAIAGPYGARRTPRSVTMAVTSAAGVTSNAGLRAAAPSGAIVVPAKSSTSVSARSSIGDAAPVERGGIDGAPRRDDVERDAVGARGEARPYVPILLATSPLAAMRSAPTTTACTMPRAMMPAAAPSTMTSYGMPSAASSHAVRRAPWRSGRVSSTKTRATLPCRCARRDDAECGTDAAGRERAGVAVGEEGRAVGDKRGAEAGPCARRRRSALRGCGRPRLRGRSRRGRGPAPSGG